MFADKDISRAGLSCQSPDELQRWIEDGFQQWSRQLQQMLSQGARLRRKRQRLVMRLWNQRRDRNLRRAVMAAAAAAGVEITSPDGQENPPGAVSLEGNSHPAWIDLRMELVEVKAQLDASRRRMAEVETELQSQWQSRCEVLEQELDRVECENVRLIAELGVARSSRPADLLSAGESPEKMTWEQRKAAILEQLDREDEPRLSRLERDSLRRQVEHADTEIRRRDAELQQLREQLGNVGSLSEHAEFAAGREALQSLPAQDAPASHNGTNLSPRLWVDDLIDADPYIAQERQKAESLRTQWEQTLRSAEVELSLERAKLARQWHELERRQDDFRRELDARDRAPAYDSSASPVQHTRGGLREQFGILKGGEKSANHPQPQKKFPVQQTA